MLYVAAPHLMPIVLIDAEYGIRRLKESHASGAWPPGRALVPGWLRSYQVTKSGIAGGEPGQAPRVTVTWAQLERFARELPVHLRAVLMDARKTDRNDCHAAVLTVLGLDGSVPRQLDLFGAST